jgi:hypothetical protein
MSLKDSADIAEIRNSSVAPKDINVLPGYGCGSTRIYASL